MKIQTVLQDRALDSERVMPIVQSERVRRTAIHPQTVQEAVKTAINPAALRDDHEHREGMDAMQTDQGAEAVTGTILPLTTLMTRKRKVVVSEVEARRDIAMMSPLKDLIEEDGFVIRGTSR